MKSAEYVGKIRELKVHDHACMVYENIDEWRKMVVPFIIDGLKNNEKCCYILAANTAGELIERFTAEGINSASLRKSGQLFFIAYKKSYLINGSFNPDEVVAFLDAETKKALDEGYSSLRVTVETDWILNHESWKVQFLKNENNVAIFLQNHSCTCLCQYNSSKFTQSDIQKIINLYPIIIYNHNVQRNFDSLSASVSTAPNLEKIDQQWLNNLVQDDGLTELIKVREELVTAAQKYEALAAIINDGVVILQDGIIKSANKAMMRMLEANIDELFDKAFKELFVQEYRQLIANKHERTLIGEVTPERYEAVIASRKGKSIPVEITTTSIVHEGYPADMLVLRDLTKTKSTERMFNALSSGTPMGLFIVQDGKFKFVGSQFEKVTGYSAEESYDLIPQKLIHPDDRETARKNAIDMLKGKRSSPYEYRIVRKNGQTSWFVESVASIDYQGKRAVMIAGIDITEQKGAETVKKEAEQRAQIASRLATVGEMAAGIAHEINNPLTTVIGYTELLMQGDVPEQIRKDLRYINSGAQRVADIVHRMLTFSRQTKPERRYVNINDIIQNTIDMQLYSLNNSNIQVEMKLDRDLPFTMVDSGQLQQVFLNLIINAMTEMKMAHDRGRMQIQTRQVDNLIRITFKDDGPGISKENIEKIFNPFFTTREIGQGTGLGLSVCHGIVTGHNGKIYVKSRLGKGATFFIDLPVVLENTQLEFEEPAPEEISNKVKARILVVDDEMLIRRLLTRILTKEGHNVDCVDNSIDALEKIRSERYNLILLDIMMPGMSGITLYENIKNIAMSLAQRIIFITGDVMGNETQKFLARTKAKYFTKPFETDKLRKEINRILSTS
jgi:PAS domain S-box-containing protein